MTLAISPPDSLIRRGSRIFFHNKVREAESRLSISSGTQQVDKSADHQYLPWASVPKSPWRSPSPADLQILTGHTGSGSIWDTGVDVAVIDLPTEYTLPFATMLEDEGIRERCVPGEYTSISRHPQWASNLDRLRGYVAGLSNRAVTEAIFFRITDPGLQTVTRDEFGSDKRNFAGLHVDSWDRLPLRTRHRSRNRLCINFGRESRYSLFINLPLMHMFRHLKLRDPEDIYEDYRGLYLGHRFMKEYPDYPAIRLQIDPGEAYIMPTDSLIHDASTEGKRFPDITLTFLGYFVPHLEDTRPGLDKRDSKEKDAPGGPDSAGC
jgi:hypothetical protein